MLTIETIRTAIRCIFEWMKSHPTIFLISVFSGCLIIGIGVLAVSAIVDKNLGPWGILAVVALIFAAFSCAIYPVISGSYEDRAANPRNYWHLPLIALVGTFAALGVLSDVLGLLDPRPAVESSPGAIERQSKEISESLQELNSSKKTKLSKKIFSGNWGERGCNVIYSLKSEKEFILIEAIKRPSGATPYKMTATIIRSEENAIEIRAETPEHLRGRSATFRYWTNGSDRKITWVDHGGKGQLDLFPCS